MLRTVTLCELGATRACLHAASRVRWDRRCSLQDSAGQQDKSGTTFPPQAASDLRAARARAAHVRASAQPTAGSGAGTHAAAWCARGRARDANTMGCFGACFGDPPVPQPLHCRSHVLIRAQLARTGMIRSGSSTRLRAVQRDSVTAIAIDTDNTPISEEGLVDLPPFTPPTSFPGLATTVAATLKERARADRVEVLKVNIAPAAGGVFVAAISVVCECHFPSGELCALWGAKQSEAAVDDVEEALSRAIELAPPPGLEAVLMVALSGDGKREEGSTRRSQSTHRARPSNVTLRNSTTSAMLAQEMGRAPPGTFPAAPAGGG